MWLTWGAFVLVLYFNVMRHTFSQVFRRAEQ